MKTAGWWALVAIALIAWLLCHDYQGIFHDANVYTLQALSHVHPELKQDVFLRFGSQDTYSLFSPLYAGAIQFLGVDHAAALLTFLSQAALFAAAYYLARGALSSQAALLGLILLIAMPGDYGPARVFNCVEPYLTPRMLAEAAGCAALGAAMRGRMLLSALGLLCALLMHPVMGLGSVAAVLALRLILPRPRFAMWLLVPFALALAFAWFGAPADSRGSFDPNWLSLVQARSPYLFVLNWSFEDWTRATPVVATLVLAAAWLEGSARDLCRASLLVAVGGWLFTLVLADGLHLVLFTQAQSWRWQWVGTLTAELYLPYLCIVMWRTGTAGRAGALLLVSAWLFGEGAPALIAALAALAAAASQRLEVGARRLVLVGAAAVLAAAVVWRLATNLGFTYLPFTAPSLPLWWRRLLSLAHDGVLLSLAGALTVWVALRARHRGLKAAPLIAALLLLAVILPSGWRSWTAQAHAAAFIDKFAPWRSVIPTEAEVLWSDSPADEWILLNRPHYLSGLQTSGLVFSRAAAVELKQRAAGLADVVSPGVFLDWRNIATNLRMSPAQQAAACRRGAFDYLVSGNSIGMPALRELGKLKLYRCR